MADDAEEGARIARALGNNQVMMMGNHGVTVASSTVADALRNPVFSGKSGKDDGASLFDGAGTERHT